MGNTGQSTPPLASHYIILGPVYGLDGGVPSLPAWFRRNFCISKISGWPRRNYLASLQCGSIIRLLANACRVSSCPLSYNSSGGRETSLEFRPCGTRFSSSFCTKLPFNFFLPWTRNRERERENRVRDAPERLENIDENRGIPSINVFAPYPPPPQFQIPLRRTIGSRQKYIQILCTSDNWSSIYPSVIPCFSRISYNYDVESVKDILRKNSDVACFTIFRNFLKIPFFVPY